jgi:alpha-L-fucosidase
MFDTGTTPYRTTHPSCPFHSHPLANVTGVLLDAFRRRGLQVGTYFSKADWHHPDYWNRDLPRRCREVNYDPATSPQAWSRFVAFTHRQIEELMTGYGPIAILWLDADWVRAPSEDIRMAELVAMARRHQPGLLVVDRGVGGRFEDYKTPEQAIPEQPPAGPWESCITMAEQWSFRCNDLYKSSRQLIHMLARIVAGGGNLLLNIGPRPDGRLPREALTRLAEIGSWLRVNGAAIDGTRPVQRSTTGPLCLTRNKTTLYAICLAGEGHDIPPARIVIPAVRHATTVELLGAPGPLAWQCGPTGLTAELPDRVRHAAPCRHAWTLALTGAETDPTAAT